MLVIADSSPLIALVNVGHLDLLPTLFGQVVITPLIAQELADARRPPLVRQVMAQVPPWLLIRGPARTEMIPLLHTGECEAISLACELNADLLLIDD
jgi:predicted nucleic acid-binding protein